MNGRGQRRLGREKWKLLSRYGTILSQESFQGCGSTFHTCPSTVWSPCNGRRDLLNILFKSYCLALKTLIVLKVQILSYGLRCSTWSYPCLLLPPAFAVIQPHWPFSSPNAPALFLPQDLRTHASTFHSACNTHILDVILKSAVLKNGTFWYL